MHLLYLWATWLQPNLGHIFHIKPLSTGGTLATSVLDVNVNTLLAEHMATTKQNALLLASVANRTVDLAIKIGHLPLQLLNCVGYVPGSPQEYVAGSPKGSNLVVFASASPQATAPALSECMRTQYADVLYPLGQVFNSNFPWYPHVLNQLVLNRLCSG